MNKLVVVTGAVGIIALIIGVAIGTQIPIRSTFPIVSITATSTLTVTTSCSTTFNSIACFTISGSSTGESSCQFITDAGLFFIRVLNDSGAPVEGASISANYNEPFCPGMTVYTSTRSPLITNASGWAVDDWSLIGNYTYYINNDFNHPVNVFLTYNMSTYVSVRIPSYNITTLYEPD